MTPIVSRARVLATLLAASLTMSTVFCSGGAGRLVDRLRGDWDWYQVLGAKPTGGFEARRRFAFAHFEGGDPSKDWLRRRTGAPMATFDSIRAIGDSIVLTLRGMGDGAAFRGVLSGDSISGLLFAGGKATNRVVLVRRTSPPDFEPPYSVWKGSVSDSTFVVTIDTAVPMRARDGTRLMSFVGRPVGDGPFGVVMERTPYLRFDTTAAIYWASRGFIYVKQDLRGRGSSDGILDTNAGQIEDGFDAVEWAAALHGANGKVGMVGGSNPGLYAWYAAIAQPPHLAAIAPTVATADPIRIVPYIDMVFSPTFVPWICLTKVKDKLSDMSDVDEVRAFAHLPVIDADTVAGCPRRQFWLDWFDHQKQDAYWKKLGVENQLNRVKVPVLGIAGWHDDARGTIRNYEVMSKLPSHPPLRVVMGPGAHKGIDYVEGHFGPTARTDVRRLQLRWFDHWLKGIDNGVEREPPLDFFIIGDNNWREENEWPLARTQWTKFYLHSGGHAQTASGGGTLDTIAPGAEPADTFTYDPADPTPYLVDARELELSLNEDYATVHATRHDLLVFTTAPLASDMEITGPMNATLWAATDARDTDWHVMVHDVFPDGRALRIQDGIMRARFRNGFDRIALPEPGRAYSYNIDLWFTGRVIPAGHSIRVTVASAAFPKYDRNLNTGGDNERDTTFVTAHQRVLHDATHPSYVTLPVIPPKR
ncbi:MAG: CocE/NonD family hydrolase [Gemmatimonadaceae bacterium]